MKINYTQKDMVKIDSLRPEDTFIWPVNNKHYMLACDPLNPLIQYTVNLHTGHILQSNNSQVIRTTIEATVNAT